MRVFSGIFKDQIIGMGKVANAISVKMLKAICIYKKSSLSMERSSVYLPELAKPNAMNTDTG
jgi:hypothetical protein